MSITRKNSKLQIQHKQTLMTSYIKDGSSQIPQSPPRAPLESTHESEHQTQDDADDAMDVEAPKDDVDLMPHRNCVSTSAEFQIESPPVDGKARPFAAIGMQAPMIGKYNDNVKQWMHRVEDSTVKSLSSFETRPSELQASTNLCTKTTPQRRMCTFVLCATPGRCCACRRWKLSLLCTRRSSTGWRQCPMIAISLPR